MANYTAIVEVSAPAGDVWKRMTDWPAHSRWVPLTRVRVLTDSGDGVGARFVGRTGIGPAGFDDPMEITRWQPPRDDVPGRCDVVKLGRVVTGHARFDVTSVADGRTQVVWEGTVEVPPRALTRRLAGLLGPAAGAAYTAALRRMAHELEAERAGG